MGSRPLRIRCARIAFCVARLHANLNLMEMHATGRRRWLGGLALLLAMLMLVSGETVLKGRLKDVLFVLYWIVCFLLTGLAIIVAFLDVRALQRATREEQRDLVQSTLKEIEAKARKHRRS